MPDLTDSPQRWEVRPTLRLTSLPKQAVLGTIEQAAERVRDALRQHPNVAAAHVGIESGEHSIGITATIVLAQLSTPGAAVDEVVTLLADACAAAGLKTDVIKEVFVGIADVDPRSL